jgi:hypothetical protein
MLPAGTNIVAVTKPEIPIMAWSMLNAPCAPSGPKSRSQKFLGQASAQPEK